MRALSFGEIILLLVDSLLSRKKEGNYQVPGRFQVLYTSNAHHTLIIILILLMRPEAQRRNTSDNSINRIQIQNL